MLFTIMGLPCMITTDQRKEINNLISIVYEETEHYTQSCNFLQSSSKMTVYNNNYSLVNARI